MTSMADYRYALQRREKMVERRKKGFKKNWPYVVDTTFHRWHDWNDFTVTMV